MSRVFVSHRGADSVPANRLAAEIRGAGHHVRIQDDLQIGDNIILWMNDCLEASDVLVLCMSAHGLGPYQNAEWSNFLHLQLGGARKKVLPVFLTGGAVPAILASTLAADLVADWDAGVRALLAVLARELAR